MPLWAGVFPRSTSPVERWCTLRRAVSALVCALYLGHRVGYPKEPMPPHSVVLELHRSMPVVGRLVWIQRRQRALRRQPGDECICGYAFRGCSGSDRVGWRGMDTQWQAERPGCNFRIGRWLGGNHSGRGFRRTQGGLRDRLRCRSFLLFHGREGEGALRL